MQAEMFLGMKARLYFPTLHLAYRCATQQAAARQAALQAVVHGRSVCSVRLWHLLHARSGNHRTYQRRGQLYLLPAVCVGVLFWLLCGAGAWSAHTAHQHGKTCA